MHRGSHQPMKEKRLLYPIILLLIAVSLSVTGELLLKAGMNQAGVLSLHPSQIVGDLIRTFLTPQIIVGLGLIFIGSIFWLAVLSRVALSYAYPMLSLSYVLVVAASAVLLHEHVSPLRIIGVLIICVGVIVVSQS